VADAPRLDCLCPDAWTQGVWRWLSVAVLRDAGYFTASLDTKAGGVSWQDDFHPLPPPALDANGGLFEPLFGPKTPLCRQSEPRVRSCDGIRLCKAKRTAIAQFWTLDDLEGQLELAREEGARFIHDRKQDARFQYGMLSGQTA